MKRRDFGKVLTVGSVGAVIECRKTAQAQPKKKALMHLGCDDHSLIQGSKSNISKENLEFKARHGVKHIDGGSPQNWTVDEILQMKGTCEKYGISLDMFHVDIPRSITLATSERDRDIDELCKRIEVAGKAGIRGLNYNFLILPHQRTHETPGRGGVMYSSFDISKVTDHSLTEAGRVNREESFERIAYLHERIIPVAEKNKVQMGCHIADPPLKPNFRGVDRWNYPVFDGLKRFVETVDSPYNGFNFCVGSASEGLEDINEIYDIVRYFGERKKIFNVHFRNIRGGLNNFVEVFPDEGDIDMYRLAKVFRDVEYPYMLQPDHMPNHPDPKVAQEGFAFQHGYIKALIQTVNSEA